MSGRQFIASIVSSLAWPAAILITVVLLRRVLVGALLRIQSFEFSGSKATFTALVDYEKMVAGAAKDAGSLGDKAIVLQDVPAFSMVEELAAAAPAQAIISAWGLLEYQLNIASDRLAPNQPHGWPQVARNLEAWDKWPLLYPAVLELRRLRDYAAHSNRQPSSADAARYVSVAEDLTATVQTSILREAVLVPTAPGDGEDGADTFRRLSAVGGSSEFTEPHPATPYALPVTIYLSNKDFHQQVEDAVEELLAGAGLSIESRDDPIERSWFRRMKAVLATPAAREGALDALHIADTKFTLGPDAVITATLMGGISPVLTALQPTKDAVVRLGAVLIVKMDWVVSVNQLTAAQQAILDHRPELASAPHEIIRALQLSSSDDAANTIPQ